MSTKKTIPRKQNPKSLDAKARRIEDKKLRQPIRALTQGARIKGVRIKGERAIVGTLRSTNEHLFDRPEYWLGQMEAQAASVPFYAEEDLLKLNSTEKLKLDEKKLIAFDNVRHTVRRMRDHFRRSSLAHISSLLK